MDENVRWEYCDPIVWTAGWGGCDEGWTLSADGVTCTISSGGSVEVCSGDFCNGYRGW